MAQLIHSKSDAILAAIVVMIFLGGPAQAEVVTFDDAAGNAVLGQDFGPGGSFSDQGLTFTNNSLSGVDGSAMLVFSGLPIGNGTNSNIFAGYPTDVETITRTGGGNFNLV